MSSHKRNVEGLRNSAKRRHDEALQRTEKAIRKLIHEGVPITFQAVSRAAHVSTAWLYQQGDIKERIYHLRGKTSNSLSSSPSAQTQRSKDAVIATLRERIRQQDEEIRQLRKQIEVAYGRLAAVELRINNRNT